MMPRSSRPMNRTLRPGSYSSGRPVWRSPTTPWSSAPVRIAMMLVQPAAVAGILSHGRSGTPRQPGTGCPSTATGDGHTAPRAFAVERGDRPRVRQEVAGLPAAREQVVEVVRGRRAGAGVDPLAQVGVVQQAEVAVVDELVLLPLPQRVHGELQLVLDL